MSNYRISLGRRGELFAAQYLERLGYRIIEQNFRVKCGEIDIIAREDDYTVFIEVKTRSGTGFGHPAEAVTHHKQQQIIKTALVYMSQNNLHEAPVRFDVVAVMMKKSGPPGAELIRNAFVG
ncbi:MAG: YraN family protein [Deltaproteobacteria bacterium]|nr:YraN family protein [Deltaproteobacteria bacterium]